MPPIQKIHFTHLQQYDENHCVYLARIGCHVQRKKLVGNVTTHAQHRIICFITHVANRPLTSSYK